LEIWVESLVRQHPLIPLAVVVGGLIVLPPPTVVGAAILAYTMTILVGPVKKNAWDR
jgi:hypothetical protein